MNILYLTFYFEPDIGPGAFRNTALVHALACQLPSGSRIHVVTTQPNRYASYAPNAVAYEERQINNCRVVIERIQVQAHASGFLDQIRAFYGYFWRTNRMAKQQTYTQVVASSSRLFTAFLAAWLARRQRIPLCLDIRDLFREAILEVLQKRRWRFRPVRWLVPPLLNPVLKGVERYTFGYASAINLVSAGFRPYFAPFGQATYSYFTNAIDDAFLVDPPASQHPPKPPDRVKTILYAGNIGDGQGLHFLIPQVARELGAGYHFLIYGDGSARHQLEKALREATVSNVTFQQPVPRPELVVAYQKADYLLVHLNNLEAFHRVLPSKLFEYGATDKPILAGVTGYAARFIDEHVPNTLLFPPGDVARMVQLIRTTPYRTEVRSAFRAQFRREEICRQMARHMLRVMCNE